jgi:hypothetical protein
MDEHSQIPTIKKAVTYIVDENGNEIEQIDTEKARPGDAETEDHRVTPPPSHRVIKGR